MKYINQLDYPHIPYYTDAKNPDKTEEEKIRTVAKSGCGLACACMMIDQLTSSELKIEDCVKLSEECGANSTLGTSMKIFAPVLSEKFGVDYRFSNDLSEAIEALRSGAHIITVMKANQETGLGLFTDGGHFISLISTDGKEFCILDPSYKPEKFDREDRKGKVNTSHAPYLYCDVNLLHEETTKKENGIKYYIFTRKK